MNADEILKQLAQLLSGSSLLVPSAPKASVTVQPTINWGEVYNNPQPVEEPAPVVETQVQAEQPTPRVPPFALSPLDPDLRLVFDSIIEGGRFIPETPEMVYLQQISRILTRIETIFNTILNAQAERSRMPAQMVVQPLTEVKDERVQENSSAVEEVKTNARKQRRDKVDNTPKQRASIRVKSVRKPS